MFDDLTPRYAPDVLFSGKTGRRHLVSRFIVHPRGSHPATCPLVADCVALECQLAGGVGSRWFGCQSTYINSELRMVVIGCNSRDEVRMTWEAVKES